jgi:hypothetical protein
LKKYFPERLFIGYCIGITLFSKERTAERKREATGGNVGIIGRREHRRRLPGR